MWSKITQIFSGPHPPLDQTLDQLRMKMNLIHKSIHENSTGITMRHEKHVTHGQPGPRLQIFTVYCYILGFPRVP